MGASDWNTYIRDNMRAMNRVTAYTPIWTASTTNPTLGNGTLVGSYIKLEQLCWMEVHLTFGSTTNAGVGVYAFTAPFNAVNISTPNYRQAFDLIMLNDGIGWYTGYHAAISASTNQIDTLNASNTGPFAFGTNDIIHIQGWYRI